MHSQASLLDATPADFAHDVANPVNIEAEELVLTYLRGVRNRSCISVRHHNKAWDFEVYDANGRHRLDVKADWWADSTGNCVFEHGNRYKADGFFKKTWGWHPDLDIVAIVGVHTNRCVFVRLPPFRALVERRRPWDRLPPGWKFRKKDNGAYITESYCVPMQELWEIDAIESVVHLPFDKFRRD